MNILTLCPVRINFLGGWSDQLDWKYSSAVVNAAVGWKQDETDDIAHPLIFYKNSFWSKIAGQGTGLGVSSILASARFLHRNFGNVSKNKDKYIHKALDWEQKQGTKGGWQDQIGGIHPGLKLIKSNNHTKFDITVAKNHSIMNHIVLFDSGLRRPAKHIGDRVRELMISDNKRFVRALRQNVAGAQTHFQSDATAFFKACLAGWQRLVKIIPEMAIELPELPQCWGSMLVGAGGGGWGMYFVKNPDDRNKTISNLASRGLKAYEPILLDGIQHIEVSIK